MGLYHFIASEFECDEYEKVIGVEITVETRGQPKPSREKGLKKWAIRIVDCVINGELNETDLIEESVHIRAKLSDATIFDTITRRAE